MTIKFFWQLVLSYKDIYVLIDLHVLNVHGNNLNCQYCNYLYLYFFFKWENKIFHNKKYKITNSAFTQRYEIYNRWLLPVCFTWYLSFNAGYFNYYIAMVDPGQINIPITKAGAIQMKKPADIKVQKLGMCDL